jgi:hypothetical protein
LTTPPSPEKIRDQTSLPPYPPNELALRAFGTRDKIWVDDHFYSDKPPLPALYLALVYGGTLRWSPA